MKRAWKPFVPYAVVSIAHLIAIIAGAEMLIDILATARMPLLALSVLLVLKGQSRTLAGILLLIAITMSWFGGLADSFGGALSLPLMLLFFGLAHLACIWL